MPTVTELSSLEGNTIGFADTRFSGSATTFPPLKFQLKMACSWGKPQGLRQIIGIDFKLVNHTSMMIRTQVRLPCRAVQLGEAVLLKQPVSPQE